MLIKTWFVLNYLLINSCYIFLSGKIFNARLLFIFHLIRLLFLYFNYLIFKYFDPGEVFTDYTGNWPLNTWDAGGLVIAHSNVVAAGIVSPAPIRVYL